MATGDAKLTNFYNFKNIFW